MARVIRSSLLIAVVLILLLLTLPGEIRRLIETGDLYLFSQGFFRDLAARLSGPGRLRFILQPAMAILLGARDGARDFHAGSAAFLRGLLLHHTRRAEMLRDALASVRDLLALAILMDLISQFLIFREIDPLAAILLGPVLIGAPYAVARALGNRVLRRARGVTSAQKSS